MNKNKIARLNLEEETESILRTQASSDIVKTPEDHSSWTSEYNLSQSAPTVNIHPTNRNKAIKIKLIDKKTPQKSIMKLNFGKNKIKKPSNHTYYN